jgi:hypothetical protein
MPIFCIRCPTATDDVLLRFVRYRPRPRVLRHVGQRKYPSHRDGRSVFSQQNEDCAGGMFSIGGLAQLEVNGVGSLGRPRSVDRDGSALHLSRFIVRKGEARRSLVLPSMTLGLVIVEDNKLALATLRAAHGRIRSGADISIESATTELNANLPYQIRTRSTGSR